MNLSQRRKKFALQICGRKNNRRTTVTTANDCQRFCQNKTTKKEEIASVRRSPNWQGNYEKKRKKKKVFPDFLFMSSALSFACLFFSCKWSGPLIFCLTLFIYLFVCLTDWLWESTTATAVVSESCKLTRQKTWEKKKKKKKRKRRWI